MEHPTADRNLLSSFLSTSGFMEHPTVDKNERASTMVTEGVDGSILGTGLTLQTALGFLLTLASI